jgi:hypothetical protein
LNPKKVKNLIVPLSLEMKEDIVLLQKLNSFYWSKVREILSTTEEVHVEILNLGQFTRKHWNLERMINKYTGLYEAIKDTGRTQMITKVSEDVVKLNRMRDAFYQELNRKEEKKKIRNEYNKTMEEQRSDTGRNNKLSI